MKYKCIIFDCDGILVDSEAISSKVLIEMVKSVGLNIDLDYAVKHFSGISLKSTFDYIEGMIGKSLPVEFEKEYRKNTFKAFKTDLKPVNGVHDLLNRITLPYCVASSGPLEKIKLNLKTTNLIEKFENKIFSSYEIGSWKPDPGIFLFAAKKMGYKPNQCVVIEDSMAGIKAAKAGGFDVYALVKNRNENVLENTGVNVFYDMNNLDSLLNI